nr:hypothetical protein [Tanacetum cinerariifolium]
MYLLNRISLTIVIILFFFTARAQDSTAGKSLNTGYSGNNQQFGIIFDVETVSPIKITGFDLRFTSKGNTTVDIYYKKDSYAGFINDKSAWTKISSTAIGVTSIQHPVKILLPREQLLNAQETGAFYIISTGIYISYSNGSTLGQEIARDAVLTLKQGYGTNKPAFGTNTAIYAPRAFNGAIHYMNNSPLPVTLTSFTGQTRGTSNHLLWQTTSEANNAYFVLEHSANGQVFAPLATIAGVGVSQQTRNYVYIDAASPGRWYYRLRQVDYDGSAHYSSVIVLTSSLATLTAYPNPVQKELYIAPPSNAAYPLTLQLFTADGRLVHQKQCADATPQSLCLQGRPPPPWASECCRLPRPGPGTWVTAGPAAGQCRTLAVGSVVRGTNKRGSALAAPVGAARAECDGGQLRLPPFATQPQPAGAEAPGVVGKGPTHGPRGPYAVRAFDEA